MENNIMTGLCPSIPMNQVKGIISVNVAIHRLAYIFASMMIGRVHIPEHKSYKTKKKKNNGLTLMAWVGAKKGLLDNKLTPPHYIGSRKPTSLKYALKWLKSMLTGVNF